jgi:galactokinase
MDQVCALGRGVSALSFDGDAMNLDRVEVGGAFPFLIADLRRGKDTRRILRDLQACFPDAPGARAARVREALGPANRALHVRARAALEAGDVESLGALMTEAQTRFDRDVAPACPELAAPALHALLAHPAVAELGCGAKGVGSQGDGCAQLLCRDAAARSALAERLERDLGVACLPLTLQRDEVVGCPAPRRA